VPRSSLFNFPTSVVAIRVGPLGVALFLKRRQAARAVLFWYRAGGAFK
jgi:hypothetical protein